MKQPEMNVQVQKDLLEDAVIFLYVRNDYAEKIRQSKAWLDRNHSHRISELFTDELLKEIDRLGTEISDFRSDVMGIADGKFAGMYETKRKILESLHELGGLVGQVIVMTHWQSPAVSQSVTDNAGERTGKITSHHDDYTRDQHAVGRTYEKKYRDVFIALPKTVPVFAYATVSGMAAVTTAALLVLGETDPGSTVIVGASCYFESKRLLHKLFGTRIREVHLADREALMTAVRTYAPSAVFVDPVGNEPDMTRVDVGQLASDVSGVSRSHVYVVADVSASSFRTTLIRGMRMPPRVTLIGTESQNKFLQYGLDRVTGGMVWGTGFSSMKLYEYRDHAGVNSPDVAVASLPSPHKPTVSLYMHRLERNAKILADSLRDSAVLRKKKVSVIYPENPHFSGAYFMLSFPLSIFRTYETFIRSVMRQAVRDHIPLVEGTSFGMQTTRIYAVAKSTAYSRPFLRISPGTETYEEIEKIADLFVRCL